jgi:CRP/FNR family cyclic AMP-dependent transcriptional regulator
MNHQSSPRLRRQLCLVRNDAEKLQVLATCELFSELRSDELQEISEHIPLVMVPTGYLFSQPGDIQTRIFILHSGRVQIYYLSAEGRKFILTTVEPISWFGEAALTQRPAQAFTIALEPSMVSVLHYPDFERLLARRGIAIALGRSLAQRLLTMEERFAEAMFKTVPARLAGLLLQLARSDTPYRSVVQGFSHQHLANLLGVHRETVTQALSTLRNKGVIEMGRKQILIVNPSALRQLAQEDQIAI